MENTEELSLGHAMQRAATLFGSDQRAIIVGACVQAAMHNNVNPSLEELAPLRPVAEHARDLFVEVIKAFTPHA